MKKSEVGSKDPKSAGEKNNLFSQAKASAKIKYQTAEFLVNGGNIEQIENGVMIGDGKGHTALRINNNG
ncbi:MAG: hypothetical protein COB12_12530 [Flavobacterium sp.]|nr:MAG: hypothetical protein COB12_12530 [Flavobacterium sp.]